MIQQHDGRGVIRSGFEFCFAIGVKIMHDPKDGRVMQQVNNKLASRGFGSQSRLTVQTANGMVTISGSVQYAHQKRAAVKTITGLAGVRRVIDQLIIKPAAKR
jgi:osmotically-inducible protein OsmY